ncbi:hypothetical protein AA309_23505 [Microvirga vignae]|uniref:GapR-like DNA-binding domain-containing protein n=1 Tax=Microvirga vignae TaxID=1225564 RepID=A0A0H1RE75_9HYPH|nr:hypothetical protein AA309_23505 [Microvirga vignae]
MDGPRSVPICINVIGRVSELNSRMFQNGDIKDVYAEAKGNGFDTKVLRKIVSLRKRDYAERQEEEAILELYMQALGMV